jgi:hypothetical protein
MRHQREDFRPQSIPDNTQSEEKDKEDDVESEEEDGNEEEARELVRELMQKDRDNHLLSGWNVGDIRWVRFRIRWRRLADNIFSIVMVEDGRMEDR